MSDLETRFHESWLGMVQPVEGLVVSVPVLMDAQCMHRHQPSFQQTFLDVCLPVEELPANAPKDAPVGPRRIGNLAAFLETILDWKPELYDAGDALPDDLSLYVPEGKQTLRPTLGLKRLGATAESETKHLTRTRRDGLCRGPVCPLHNLVGSLPVAPEVAPKPKTGT